MANLWRTQRPRFPLYQSDGFGRDYYIKYTNGGYWENQFNLTKKPDYERPRYKNFHSLYHMAAPFKYWGDGSGRENYILKCNGFHHDQKPLCSYQLTDFLRNSKAPRNLNKKVYLSVSENRYYQKLRNLEKKLVKRLYTDPMKTKKKTDFKLSQQIKISLIIKTEILSVVKAKAIFAREIIAKWKKKKKIYLLNASTLWHLLIILTQKMRKV